MNVNMNKLFMAVIFMVSMSNTIFTTTAISLNDPITQNFDAVTDFKIKFVKASNTENRALSNIPHPKYGEEVELSFYAHRQLFKFTLTPKHDLFTEETRVLLTNEDEDVTSVPFIMGNKGFKNIAYFGEENGNTAHVTMFNHDKIHALIHLGNEAFIIDPIEEHEHIIKKDEILAEKFRGRKMVAYRTSEITKKDVQQMTRGLLEANRLPGCNHQNLEMSIGVASDAGYTRKHGGKHGAYNQIVAILNTVNGIYTRQLRLTLKLGAILIKESVGPERWNVAPRKIGSRGAGCGIGNNINGHLDSFKRWVGSRSAPKCGTQICGIWHLMTNCNEDVQNFQKGTVGVAFVGTICQGYGGGFNSAVSSDIRGKKWIVVGHEIGHNLGAHHASTGLMSYNRNTKAEFTNTNRNVCNVINNNRAKCVKPLNPTRRIFTEKNPVATGDVMVTKRPTSSSTPRPTPRPTSRPTPQPTKRTITAKDPVATGDVMVRKRPTPSSTPRPTPQPTSRPTPQPTPPPTPQSAYRKPDSPKTLTEPAITNPQNVRKATPRPVHKKCVPTDEVLKIVGIWNVGSWSTCSKTCGGGKKERKITCMNKKSGEKIADTYCSASSKPDDAVVAPCNSQACDSSLKPSYNSNKRNDDICETPSFATCKPTIAEAGTCGCKCIEGYTFNDSLKSCIASKAGESNEETFYVEETSKKTHSEGCNNKNIHYLEA